MVSKLSSAAHTLAVMLGGGWGGVGWGGWVGGEGMYVSGRRYMSLCVHRKQFNTSVTRQALPGAASSTRHPLEGSPKSTAPTKPLMIVVCHMYCTKVSAL